MKYSKPNLLELLRNWEQSYGIIPETSWKEQFKQNGWFQNYRGVLVDGQTQDAPDSMGLHFHIYTRKPHAVYGVELLPPSIMPDDTLIERVARLPALIGHAFDFSSVETPNDRFERQPKDFQEIMKNQGYELSDDSHHYVLQLNK